MKVAPLRLPPVQSWRSSSTIDTVLAPMRRPRSRKRPSFSSVSRFAVIGWASTEGLQVGGRLAGVASWAIAAGGTPTC
jgi:hypothetical protein